MSLCLQFLGNYFRIDMSKMVEIELEFQNNLSYIFSSLFLKGKIYLLVLAEDIALFSPKLCLYA